MPLLAEFINGHSLRKPPGVRDHHAVIIDADLDLGTGLEIIPVDQRIDHRFTQGLDRVIPDLPSLGIPGPALCPMIIHPFWQVHPADAPRHWQ